MGVISNLSVSLTANTTKFKKGLAGASGTLKGFGTKIGAARGKLAGLTSGIPFANTNILKLGTVAGAAAIGGIALMVNKTLASVDATAKLADNLGILPEKLVGLHRAGELSGVSTETMNTALAKLTVNVANAAEGTGPAVDALDQLGLSADTLNKLSPDEKMLALADAFEGVELQGDKAKLATDLFGKSGLGLIKTMKGGADALDKVVVETEKMGLAFNKVDAAKIEAANDAMDDLKKVFGGIFTQLTIKLAPILEAIATKFTDMALEGESVGTKVSDAFETVLGWVGRTINGVNLLKATWNLFAGAAQLSASGITKVLAGILSGAEAVASFFGKDVDLGSSFLSTLGETFAESAARDISEAQQQLADFQNGTAGAGFSNLVSDIQTDAQANAEAATGAGKGGRVVNGLVNPGGGSTTNNGGASSVDNSRQEINVTLEAGTQDLVGQVTEAVRAGLRAGALGA